MGILDPLQQIVTKKGGGHIFEAWCIFGHYGTIFCRFEISDVI